MSNTNNHQLGMTLSFFVGLGFLIKTNVYDFSYVVNCFLVCQVGKKNKNKEAV